MSQYELRKRIHIEKLKDAEDITCYIGVFKDARRHFTQMGVTYTGEESIFDLLQGLPQVVEWEIFHKLTMNKLSLSSIATTSTGSTSSSNPFTFDNAIKLLSEKANAIIGRRKLEGPGSGYANIAIRKTNPSTGIHMHKNNPNGVSCTNSACIGKLRANNHDKTHCYWPGGGMEDTAPSWVRNSRPKGEKAAVTVISDSTPSPPTLKCELFCAAIPMIDDENKYAFLSTHAFTTILDSGTTSHLIKDRGYFTDFKDEDHPPVKTMSQEDLLTTGRGTCVIEIALGNSTH